MKDNELLELAAKAVGLHVKAQRVDADDKFTHLVVGQKFTQEKIDWNPLEDDGAALRLAVKLRIMYSYTTNAPPELCLPRDCAVATVNGRWFAELTRFDDENAATRRAIVMAAAEVGKSMQP